MVIRAVIIFSILFLVPADLSYAAPTAVIRGGTVIRNGVIGPPGPADPCAGVAVGDPCSNGVLYAGTGFAGLGSYKYMTTPGHCTDSSAPTCDGTTDNLLKKWANNSGTTAYGVNTGATSTTNGTGNTQTLITNYTDTDAARYCQNMTYPAGGYTDWYLPAEVELNLVLYAMHVAGKGSFIASYYGSSTEASDVNLRGQNFNTSTQASTSKTGSNYIRCVRKY
jgi:hypothetical protein